MRKPDATTVITVDNFKDKVWPLPVDELLAWGRLRACLPAWRCMGDLACAMTS